jgi:hypothetical protein
MQHFLSLLVFAQRISDEYKAHTQEKNELGEHTWGLTLNLKAWTITQKECIRINTATQD